MLRCIPAANVFWNWQRAHVVKLWHFRATLLRIAASELGPPHRGKWQNPAVQTNRRFFAGTYIVGL